MRILVFILAAYCFLFPLPEAKGQCYTGAFLTDKPTENDIKKFQKDYAKKPQIVMTFVDWFHFPDPQVIDAVYSQDCVLMLTLEPWISSMRKGIDVSAVLQGDYDDYIEKIARQLKDINKPVFLRFAHEMNGNWYPWSGSKIGADNYRKLYRYIKDICDKEKALNIYWVFSVNFESVPKKDNDFSLYYPGDNYVDYIGIDGYNWGNTQSWSSWKSFSEIFNNIYAQIVFKYRQPVIITEFASASGGGDKTAWIKQAMIDIKSMSKIKAFILFNIDKEVDWSFSPDKAAGKELKKQMQEKYFKDRGFFDDK